MIQIEFILLERIKRRSREREKKEKRKKKKGRRKKKKDLNGREIESFIYKKIHHDLNFEPGYMRSVVG